MRKFVKILHTLASMGFGGALAALIVLHLLLPEPADLQRFAALRIAQGAIAQWILLPSMAGVLLSGVLSMAITPGFHNAGWAWAKLGTGIIVFEGTLAFVQAPMERAADRARQALSGELSVAELGTSLPNEWGPFWVILAVAVLNVVLGVWRPRIFPRISPPRVRSESGPQEAEHFPAPGEPESGASPPARRPAVPEPAPRPSPRSPSPGDVRPPAPDSTPT